MPLNSSILCWEFIPCKQIKNTPKTQLEIYLSFVGNSYPANGPKTHLKIHQNSSNLCWKFIPWTQTKNMHCISFCNVMKFHSFAVWKNSEYHPFLCWKQGGMKFIPNLSIPNLYLYSWKFHFHELNEWKTGPMGPTVVCDYLMTC